MAPSFRRTGTLSGVALVSFAAGSLITACGVFHVNAVRAESNRSFELRFYHAVPGKTAGAGSHAFATRLQSYSPNTI